MNRSTLPIWSLLLALSALWLLADTLLTRLDPGIDRDPFTHQLAEHLAALSRNGRMRVDVAGVCWQLGAGGAMALAAACGGPAALRLGSTGVLLAVGWSLLPLLRTDGAWLAKDYLDGAGRENARTIRLVRLFQAAGPLVVAAMLCRNAWRWLRVESERSEPWTTLAAAALIVVVVVVSAAAVKRASRLVKGAMPGNGSG